MEKTVMELKIENLAQVEAAIKAFDDNFKKEEAEQQSIIVRFDEKISVEDLVETLKKLWEFEVTSNHTIDILIKNLSYAHRKEALRAALCNTSLKNPIFLTNVFCLVKGYNTFEDAYFEHEQVFLNDEVEFLDIFDDVEEELAVVVKQIAEYYVSMLKTCNLIEGVENNPNTVKIEPLYEYLFGMMDVTILAKLLTSVKDPTIWETKKIVFNGLNYLGMISEKFVFTNTVLNLLGNKLLQTSVEKAATQE